jgi:hypothetical protein
MKDKQNIIIVLLIVLIIVLVVEGVIFLRRGNGVSHPPVCAPGDAYNILTGKPCPTTAASLTTPATAH